MSALSLTQYRSVFLGTRVVSIARQRFCYEAQADSSESLKFPEKDANLFGVVSLILLRRV